MAVLPVEMNFDLIREREERRLRALQRKNLTPQGNHLQQATRSAPAEGRCAGGGKNALQQGGSRTAPAAPASPLSLAPNLQSNDDLTYQSTLLHMRVVGKQSGESNPS